jgi:SAM-dependent methyltransferase
MKEYYYNESIARFYDKVYDKLEFLKPAQKFYHEEIMTANGPVLEAGVGSGRIFVPALNAGADIYGIDISENMLKQLINKLDENNRHRVSINDIRNFRLDKKFDLVISPFRVFQHLLTIDQQLNALNSVYEHLNPGGRYIFDVFNPDLSRLIKDVDNLLEFEGEYEPGKKLKRYVTVKNEINKQILNVTFSFAWDENGEEKHDEFFSPMRYFFRYELEHLVSRTKFKSHIIYGDFERNDIENNHDEFIVVCKK